MKQIARKPIVCVVTGVALWLAGCGGSGGTNQGGGAGSKNPTTPTVVVTPGSSAISPIDSLQVTVTVASTSGTPTGTVVLTSGSYSSLPAALSSGKAAITIPTSTLPAGTHTLKGSYTPDSASSSIYNSASGTATVTVSLLTPTVNVTPSVGTIGSNQQLSVAMTVTGVSGGPIPTGSVTLTSGSYASAATQLSNGSTTILIDASMLSSGNNTLKASYTPDAASSNIYASNTGSATVAVATLTTPAVTVTPGSASLSTAQALNVTVRVTGSGSIPTGSVVLSSGGYTSPATTLTNGSATINVSAYSLGYGSNTLSVAYIPDALSATVYSSALGTASVSVARAMPTVAVTPASLNISPLDRLDVTVTVGGGGAPVGTGSITLSGGGFTSASVTLSGSSTIVNIPAGALTPGSDTLAVTYTPDAPSKQWYNANTGTSAAIVVSSLVTVNQSTVIAPVTDQLLGMNLAAWYDVVGNANSINAAFAQAGIKAIRWPGGSWSDAYHWGDSGTPVSKCKNPNDANDGTWPGVVTFPQFISSIAKAGQYDLALTANYGSNVACNGPGDPQEAADWAAEAFKEGWPASHMTIGNENYGTWEVDLHQAASDRWNPTTYANSVIGDNGFYKKITAASPTTKVGVVVNAGSAVQTGWDPIVLSMAKGLYDFVEYHYYAKDPGQESDMYLVHTAADDLATNLNTLKSELNSAGVDVPIYVGEMGSVSSNPGKQSWSITQGLYAGQALGEMMKAGVARATWWIGFGNCNGDLGSMSSSLYGWQSFGAYNVFSDGPGDTGPNNRPCAGAGSIGTMSPTAQAFNLFHNIAVNGERVLSTIVTDNTDKNIRAYAATHSGGTALFLFNLNQNQSQPVTVSLPAQNGTKANDVQVITYDKEIYDRTNAATPVWDGPTTTPMGAPDLPLALTLKPWSMNVVIIR